MVLMQLDIPDHVHNFISHYAVDHKMSLKKAAASILEEAVSILEEAAKKQGGAS